MGQAHRPQQDHPPCFFTAQRLTTSDRVAANEVLLQLDLFRRRNHRVGKPAEPCVHSIDPPIRNCQPYAEIIAPIDAIAGIITQENFRPVTTDRNEHGQVQVLVSDGEFRFPFGIQIDSPIPDSGITV